MSLASSDFVSIENLLCAPRTSATPVAFGQQQVISWCEFQHDVACYVNILSKQEAKRVALCFSDSYLFAVGFFAACYAQKALVLPGNYQTEAVKELQQHFDLLLHDDAVPIATGLKALTVNKLSSSSAETSSVSWQPLDTANLEVTLFTSGSSGSAKAISKSLEQLDIELTILQSLWGDKINGTRIESTVSHQHIYGLLFRLLWPLCAARPFAIQNLEFPEQIVHHASPDTVLVSSPALLKRLTQEHQRTPLRAVFSSGGPLANSAAIHSDELFNQLPIEVFGSTETGGIAHRQQFSASTPWQLFPGVEAQLNEERCLRLRSPHINGQEWYQTADECYFHDKVSFELKGRTDRIVKVEEKRISLVEVEKRLEQLEWIEESAVIPKTEENRLSLCAVIVLTEKGHQEINTLGKGKFWIALRKALRNWLEPIAIPRKYRLVDEIPLNSQGKRQVTEIEKLFQ
ncbi:AMP-binding protein [Vibrio ouci]|uniref:Acyl-CoA synthetase n=1 Tax=Vibrio ouci TaxID=2499078 RepID=A0A4Y8WLM3_9VIBR|nr:AMP-binding protein [Vibrio ouci]TFH93168.1 acyl-CoA synthetase [Vibrio ouci]